MYYIPKNLILKAPREGGLLELECCNHTLCANFFRAETEQMNRNHTYWRVRQQPRKKKHSLHFWFGGGEISFEKGKGVFLSGFCPLSIRAVRGASMRTRQSEKTIFSGGRDFSFCLGWFPARRRDLGRNAGGIRIGGFRRRISYFALRNAPQKSLTGNL